MFSKVAPAMVTYGIIAIGAQYISNLGGTLGEGEIVASDGTTQRIGLITYTTPLLSIGLQFVVTLFVAAYVRKMAAYEVAATALAHSATPRV